VWSVLIFSKRRGQCEKSDVSGNSGLYGGNMGVANGG
jgi:hypothetical protein